MRTGRLTAVAVVAAALAAAAAAAVAGVSAHSASTPKRIAFVNGRIYPKVWVARANGSGAKRLGAGGSAVLSPSGAYVAAAEYGNSGPALRIYTVGGAAHNFFSVQTGYVDMLAWSHDSRYLALELSGSTSSALYVIDTTTMSAVKVAGGYVSGVSFAPSGRGPTADELVYGLAKSQTLTVPVNLWESAPDGTGHQQITTNGRSLNPVWGRKGIVFDRERIRRGWAPEYQLWVRRGSALRQLTHMKVNKLVEGLVPIGVSAGGNRLIAEFEGQDTSNAWSVQLKPRRIRQVKVKGYLYAVQGAAISRNGRRLLVDQGAFEQSANHGTVEWVPFAGGRGHHLARGANPSWNQ